GVEPDVHEDRERRRARDAGPGVEAARDRVAMDGEALERPEVLEAARMGPAVAAELDEHLRAAVPHRVDARLRPRRRRGRRPLGALSQYGTLRSGRSLRSLVSSAVEGMMTERVLRDATSMV